MAALIFIRRNKMKVTVALRGTLKKLFGGPTEKVVEIPEGSTCEDALLAAGIDYKQTHNFGFVSVNGMRVMIYDEVKDGDYIKAFSRVTGG
jgi:sulfur carrier protein ThiS